MSRRREAFNPFYALVLVTSVLFVVTALAYVTSWVIIRPVSGGPGTPAVSPAMRFLDERGESMLLWQAGLLTGSAILAMGFDRWRSRRAERSRAPDPDEPRRNNSRETQGP